MNTGNPLRRVRARMLLVLLGLAGCFSLGRNSPPQQYYVLGAHSGNGAAVAPDSGAAVIGLRRLDLASYLAVPFVAVRHGANRVTFSEFHRWGEGLGDGINRALAGYLGGRTPSRTVDVAPWPLRARHDFLIQVHILRFEGVAPEEPSSVEGEAHMIAAWEIIRPEDATVLARGTTERRTPGWRVGDHAGLVALLDTHLSDLADDVARALDKLEREP